MGATESWVRDGRQPSKAQLRWRLSLLLATVDACVLLFAHAAAGALRFGDAFDREAMTLFAALLPLFWAAAFANDAYAVPALVQPLESMRRGLKALVAALAAAMFFIFLLQYGTHVSRFTFAAAALIAAVSIASARWLIARNATAVLDGEPYDVIVIADGDFALPMHDAAVVVDAADGLDPAAQGADMFDRLGRLVEHADRVVIACPPDRRQLWSAALQGANIQAEVIAPELASLRPLGIASHLGMPTMIVAQVPLSWRDRVLKRGFDLAVALFMLALLGLPLLVLALAVRLSSPGPALFRQPRVGRDNRLFQVLKLRTMHVLAADAAGHRSATRDDDRITPLGRVLRATSIDELPQLINVLRGEMSIVGPRPHAIGSRAEDQLFWEVDARYRHRHAIKPGLTGLAQVRGLRGATNVRADLVDRLHADLEYRNNWSIWRDIAILLRTAPALFHRNAF